MSPEPALTVEPWEDGSSFPVKAHPAARRDGLAGLHDGMLKVDATTAPEKGKANKAIAKILARALGVAPADVVLLSGDTNQRKRFGVRGVPPNELSARVRSALAEAK